MTSRAWTVRPLQQGDIGEFRRLYHTLHGFSRPEEYDDWLFNRNTYGFPVGTIAAVGDRIVGLYMLTPVSIAIAHIRVRGAQSVDTMTDPEFRNQGIFVTLAKCTIKRAATLGYKVLYGLPNENSYHGFVRRLDWCHVGNVDRWIRVLRPGQLGRLPYLLRAPLDHFASALPSLVRKRFAISVQPLSHHTLSPLLNGFSGEATCCVAHDLPWITWRYDQATGMQYEWVSAWHGGQCQGAVLWGMRGLSWGMAANQRAKIVEVLGADADAVAIALSETARRAASRGASAVEALSISSLNEVAMRKAWFFKHGKPPLIVKRLVAADALPLNVYDDSLWRLRGGDSDTF